MSILLPVIKVGAFARIETLLPANLAIRFINAGFIMNGCAGRTFGHTIARKTDNDYLVSTREEQGLDTFGAVKAMSPNLFTCLPIDGN